MIDIESNFGSLLFFCFIFLSIDRLFVLYELWHALYFARIEAFAFNPFAKKEHFFFREQWRAMSSNILRFESFMYISLLLILGSEGVNLKVNLSECGLTKDDSRHRFLRLPSFFFCSRKRYYYGEHNKTNLVLSI